MSTPFTNTVPVVSIAASADYRVSSLLDGERWGSGGPGQPVTLTYSFAGPASTWDTAADEYSAASGSVEPFAGLAALTPSERDSVRAALAAWGAVANIRFNEVTETPTAVGELRFAWTQIDPSLQSVAYEPATNAKGGDVWLNAMAPWDATWGDGSYEFSTLLHEIGHALGLKHPFEDTPTLPVPEDGYTNTVMTYTAYAGSDGSWTEFEPTTPMLYDVLALQYVYGPNTTWHAGDDVYGYHQGTGYFQTIWDAGGNDTIIWDATTESGAIDLRAGRFSDLGDSVTYWDADFVNHWTDTRTVAIAFGVTIENATGGAAQDLLVGNDAANRLVGNAGNDTIDGGAGDDTLNGGDGSDQLAGGPGTDTAIFGGVRSRYQVSTAGDTTTVFDTTGAEGTDTLTGVEYLKFTDVTLALGNLPPVAANTTIVLDEDDARAGTLPAATDPNDDPVTYAAGNLPTHGALTVEANGAYTYTPAANWSGSDSFGYLVSDNHGGANSYTVSVVVVPVNDPPASASVAFATSEDTAKSGTLPAATDPDGDPVTYALATAPAHGSASVSAAGAYTYTPAADYFGADGFVFSVSDGKGGGSLYNASVTVSPVNDAPVSSAAAITADMNGSKSGTLPAANDAEGDAITYALAGGAQHGAASVGAGGTYTYTPAAGYVGNDTFGFSVRDSAGASNTYTVSVSVADPAHMIGGPGNDTLTGTAGDDTLIGNGGNDFLDGLAGTDTARFAGARTGFTVQKSGLLWRVTDMSGPEGSDTLSHMETLQFSDKSFTLVEPAHPDLATYAASRDFLFDPVYYLLANSDLVPGVKLAGAIDQYLTLGADQGRAPNSWFDATYYENKWADLGALHLDDATLFVHFQRYGVWEGRSPGPEFDHFDGARYLRENPDVAGYVNAHLPDFLGSATNGAIAHFIIYGAGELRVAYETTGGVVDLGYVI